MTLLRQLYADSDTGGQGMNKSGQPGCGWTLGIMNHAFPCTVQECTPARSESFKRCIYGQILLAPKPSGFTLGYGNPEVDFR
jgi:hypothetical protein